LSPSVGVIIKNIKEGKMPITNQDIYKKLEQIEKSINILAQEESEQLVEEKRIKFEEGKVMGILNKKVALQFDNIIDWKRFVWDSCPYRKTHEKEKMVDFICKKTSNKCRFQDCFRNRL